MQRAKGKRALKRAVSRRKARYLDHLAGSRWCIDSSILIGVYGSVTARRMVSLSRHSKKHTVNTCIRPTLAILGSMNSAFRPHLLHIRHT